MYVCMQDTHGRVQEYTGITVYTLGNNKQYELTYA